MGSASGKPAAHGQSSRAHLHASRSQPTPTAMTVAGILPTTADGPISGSDAIVVELSEPLSAHSPMPQISMPGTWQQEGTSLMFQPTLGILPSTTVSLSVPGGSNGLEGADGSRLAAPVQASWTVQPGSLLRAYQILATLGYLPVTWTPSSPTPMTTAEAADALFSPPDGTFAWRYPNTPPQLQAMWAPGQDDVLLQGAVMAFESDQGMTADGQVGQAVWAKLLQVTASPSATSAATSQAGYTYTSVSKTLPESMTVWHDGAVVEQTAVNTGIPGYDTGDGSFPVFERLQTQVMQGTNPDGSHYADPVAWVAYFDGSEAVHYIERGSYGSPQSLGCVEASYSAAEEAWPYLTIGSLVTVSG
jgi:peptidoglycan hydrolase-like protein with peptidoglycan-binding domain